MNPRYKPGGDKYESIQSDAIRTWVQMVNDQQQDILDTLKAVVSTWTENEIEKGFIPVFEDFLNQYPEYDHEALYANISEEMNRIATLVSRPSKAVQGA